MPRERRSVVVLVSGKEELEERTGAGAARTGVVTAALSARVRRVV